MEHRKFLSKAIWDVIHALKWVRNEIEEFGGDKNNITIAGESAGSVTVSLLSITDHAKGLYKRPIMESGSSMWLSMDDYDAVFKRSFAVAQKVGCANESFTLDDHADAIERCMRGIDALTIIKAEGSLNPGAASSFLPRWGDALFPRNPREVTLNGGFQFQELFIGDSGMEGAFKVPTQNPDIFGFFGKEDVSITREQGVELLLKAFSTFQDKDKLVEHYFPSENDDSGTSRQYEYVLANALGDFGITCPTVNYAVVSAQSGINVYYYDFQHRPKNSVWAEWMGITHFDEVDFVFGGPFKKPSNDWPLYGEKFEMKVYTTGDPPTLGHGPRTNSCMFWQPYLDPDDKLTLLQSD
ncbi:unnamed protein product [Larinioides sclopetarius]|uniref:Carboxylic ester hydrolase n=1 Tax=Larinioides sclopetarius TaxID=280406 RepID=A0AAV2B8J3_9ARAC